MDTSRIIMVLAVLLLPPLLSWGISELARGMFLHRAPAEARVLYLKIEKTVRDVAAVRKQDDVSEEQMKELLSRVVEVSLTEDRGKRMIDRLKDVDVQGGPRTREALIRSAERALHARFARELTQGA